MLVNEDIDEKERGGERLRKSKKTGKRNETQESVDQVRRSPATTVDGRINHNLLTHRGAWGIPGDVKVPSLTFLATTVKAAPQWRSKGFPRADG